MQQSEMYPLTPDVKPPPPRCDACMFVLAGGSHVREVKAGKVYMHNPAACWCRPREERITS